MNITECKDRPTHSQKVFCFFLDGERFRTRKKVVTPPEIREIAGGLSPSVPIVICLDDDTQRTLREDESVALEPCRHFKKLPRFKRG